MIRVQIDCSDEDAAWAAGFFDGEGHVGIHRINDRRLVGGVRGFRLAPRLVIGCTAYAPLVRYQELFGGTLRLRRKQAGRHKACWEWSINGGRSVLLVAEVIRPYLLVKGAEMDIIMEFCDRLSVGLRKLTVAEMEARNELASRLAACASRTGTGRGRVTHVDASNAVRAKLSGDASTRS